MIGDVIPPRERGKYQGYFGARLRRLDRHRPAARRLLRRQPLVALDLLRQPPDRRDRARRDRRSPSTPGPSTERHAIDYLGAALLAGALSSIVLFTSLGGTTWAWASPADRRADRRSASCSLPAFVWVERRAAEPIIPLSLFRNRTFSVTSAVGFIVGFALFGAITYLPLYFQITKGSSPTKSGLQLTPLMAGVLVTSIVSGQLISRLGPLPDVPDRRHGGDGGRDVPALATRAFARTSGSRRVYALVLGLGLGMVMQVLVLAAQNAVDFRRSASRRAARRCSARSAARSASRSSGRSSRTGCTSSSPRACRCARHPEDGQPGGRQAPAAGGTQAFEDAFAAALHPVFLVAAAVSVLAFALTWLLRDVPLRTGTPAGDAIPPPQGDRAAHEAAALGRSRQRRVALLGNSQACLICLLSVLPPLSAQRARTPSYADDPHPRSGSGSPSRSSSRSRASRTASTARRSKTLDPLAGIGTDLTVTLQPQQDTGRRLRRPGRRRRATAT